MDISVKHLNDRMALQVPPELPLGLVFIVGQVENLQVSKQGIGLAYFDLAEVEYRLQCRLPGHVVKETLLKNGDRIRVGGHLSFDSRRVQYYLLARDLEVLPQQTPVTVLPSAQNAVEANSEQAALVPAELPPWVLELAPPEIRHELGLEPPAEQEPEFDVAPAHHDSDAVRDAVALASASGLSPEMVRFLSSAIDNDEDIELTAEIIAEYLSEEQTPLDEESEEAPPPVGEATLVAHDTPSRPVADEPVEADTDSPTDDPVDDEESLTLWQVLILLVLALLVVIIAAQLFFLLFPR